MIKIAPSLMFHHFHGTDHYSSQGSISQEDLHLIIKKIKKSFNILNANVYADMYMSNSLKTNDVCFTFDDGLMCQYAIALEVLDYHNIKAFWFVPSEAIEKKHSQLEVYRYFRSVYFEDIEDFYKIFFSRLNLHSIDLKKEEASFLEKNHLGEFLFYSHNDRLFRYLRDITLGQQKYFHIMDKLLEEYKVDISKTSEKLLLSERHLKALSSNGQVLGAHSYSHPTSLSSLTQIQQREEYSKNINHLNKYSNDTIYSVAHPCNSYNQDTLEILKNLGIKLGFRSNNIKQNFSDLELPRIDHTEVK